MPNTNMDTFNNHIMAEIENKSVETLISHPTRILDAAIYAVERVFVSNPEDDSPETKKQVLGTLLTNLATLVTDTENPLGIEFVVDPETNGYTGSVRFNITKEIAKNSIFPDTMLERSYLNRVRKAAKNLF